MRFIQHSTARPLVYCYKRTQHDSNINLLISTHLHTGPYLVHAKMIESNVQLQALHKHCTAQCERDSKAKSRSTSRQLKLVWQAQHLVPGSAAFLQDFSLFLWAISHHWSEAVVWKIIQSAPEIPKICFSETRNKLPEKLIIVVLVSWSSFNV